jgi:hypothetical protein
MTNTTTSPQSPPVDLWDELSRANTAMLQVSRHIATAISDRHPVFKAIIDRMQESVEALLSNLTEPAIIGMDSYPVHRLAVALNGAGSALWDAAGVIADAEGVNEEAYDALQAAARTNRVVMRHFQARGLLQEEPGADG